MPVYFIQVEGRLLVKIGFARDIEKRLRLLQCGCPYKLLVIRSVDGGVTAEKWLHKQFAEQHMRGEWFNYHPDMMTVEPPAGRRRGKPFSATICGHRVSLIDLEARAKAAGLSLAEVARKAEIAPITFRRWRAGKISPRLDKLSAVEKVVMEAELKKAS